MSKAETLKPEVNGQVFFSLKFPFSIPIAYCVSQEFVCLTFRVHLSGLGCIPPNSLTQVCLKFVSP